MFSQKFIELGPSAALHETETEKNSDDAESNVVVATADSNE